MTRRGQCEGYVEFTSFSKEVPQLPAAVVQLPAAVVQLPAAVVQLPAAVILKFCTAKRKGSVGFLREIRVSFLQFIQIL